MWCNFEFEGVLFRSGFRHNDRVDSPWECAKKQAVVTVVQWHINQIIRGPLVIGKNPAQGLICPKSGTDSGVAYK